MSIAVGDSLPEATFRVLGPEGIDKLSTKDIFAGKKVVLFAVPGAFTDTDAVPDTGSDRDARAGLGDVAASTVP